MKATVSTDSIIVESDMGLGFDEVLDYLNRAEGKLAYSILEVMPEDYDYIMNQCDYGILFSMGSPHMMDCGWKWNVEYVGSNIKAVLTNYK